jgi:ketosteroid isomerase-like protein
MTEDGSENLDRPQGTEDEVAGGVPEYRQPPAGSQRSEQSARDVLAAMESCLATHDLDHMVEFFTEDAVLLGDAEEAFGRDALRGYLRGMADMEPTVHWQWDRVVVVLDAPGVLSFAAVGSIVFNDPGHVQRSWGKAAPCGRTVPRDLPRRPRTERLATEAFPRVSAAVGRRLDRLRLPPRADAPGTAWSCPPGASPGVRTRSRSARRTTW